MIQPTLHCLLGVRGSRDAGTLPVAQAMVIHKGSPVVQQPTSPVARRVVKLPPETVTALRTRRKVQNARRLQLGEIWHDNDLVFATGEGKLLHPSNLYRTLDAIMARAQVRRTRLHDLRHSHTTLPLAAGTPIKVVSERLGHAKTSIT